MTLGVEPRGKEATAMTTTGKVSWRDRLPRGQTLPPETWARRHRAMIMVAWGHFVGLLDVRRRDGPRVLQLAARRAADRRLRVACRAPDARPPLPRRRGLHRAADVARRCSSTSGTARIEAHFHFFVMVALLADLRGVVPVPARVRRTCSSTTALMGALDSELGLRPTTTRRRTRGAGPPCTRSSSSRWAS